MTPETEALMREIAREAAVHAVNRTLLTYGIDPDFPTEFQKDMAHLREWRRRMEKIEEKSWLTLTGVFVVGFLALLWLGFKSKLGM